MKKDGFSLIDLIISISLISVLLIFMLVSIVKLKNTAANIEKEDILTSESLSFLLNNSIVNSLFNFNPSTYYSVGNMSEAYIKIVKDTLGGISGQPLIDAFEDAYSAIEFFTAVGRDFLILKKEENGIQKDDYTEEKTTITTITHYTLLNSGATFKRNAIKTFKSRTLTTTKDNKTDSYTEGYHIEDMVVRELTENNIDNSGNKYKVYEIKIKMSDPKYDVVLYSSDAFFK